MIGKILWQKLKLLSECDEAIISTQKNIDVLQEEQCSRLYAVEDLEEEIFEKQQAEVEGKKNVALQELYARELSERQDVLREKAKTVSHKKELDALEREMSDIARKQEVHDVVLMRAWQNRDQIVKQIEAQKKELQLQAEEVKASAVEYEKQIAQLQEVMQAAKKRRDDLLQGLDPEWRKKYERINNTIKDPIVALTQNSCGACFYLMASKDLVELKNNHIIVCRNCYRFIYQEEAVPVHQAAP